MLYRFVDQQKAEGFPVERICEVAGMSRSVYCDWKQHRDGVLTIAELDERRLVKEIEDIWDDSDGTYGSPRVTVELGKRGWVVNHKRVERLMRIHNIGGIPPRSIGSRPSLTGSIGSRTWSNEISPPPPSM
jgi:hypothetical protein